MRIKPSKLSLSRTKSSRIKEKQVTLRYFYENRKKILIRRSTGGLGDILMHRMMFEDFKRIMPDCEIHFAVPKMYMDVARNHPYIDVVLDANEVDDLDYIISYDTTTACGRYEQKIAPLSDLHRSDIWANHCGVILLRHNMHLSLDESFTEFGKKEIKKVGDKPSVCICPISASLGKNMTEEQCAGLVDELKNMGFTVFVLHHTIISWKLSCPQLHGYSILQWMGIINASDYIITVDTGSFHCAGGLNKPMVGFFTWADGKVYGRWYNKFVLVQKHRDNGDWSCGPCYIWGNCPKLPGIKNPLKPCLTEVTSKNLVDGFKELLERYPPEK